MPFLNCAQDPKNFSCVIVMAVKERRSMERYVGKPLFGKRLFVEPDAFGYVIALFMKDQRYR